MSIYFDNGATTPPCGKAVRAMTDAMCAFGNPESPHSAGLAAARALELDRQTVLSSLSAAPDTHLIFTSSGSEANTLALIGCATAKKMRGSPRILLSDSEHSSLYSASLRLASLGYDVVYIPTAGGELDLEYLKSAATENVILSSFMLVNNETGAVYDAAAANAAVKAAAPGAVTHTDAVQAYMKMPVSHRLLGADMISISAHKIGGPKGIGALSVCGGVIKSKKLIPVVFGGEQEDGLRGGTHNTIGIAGFAAAVRAHPPASVCAEKVCAVRSLITDTITNDSRFCGVHMNIPAKASPYILSITLPDIKSETMVNYLSARGIYVSNGAACSAHAPRPSRPLLAFGLTASLAGDTLRISFSHENTSAEARAFLSALAEGLCTLVKHR